MDVRVNGNDVVVPDGATISVVLSENGFDASHVVVEMNGEIIEHSDFEKVVVPENATLEVLRFVGGG